MCSFFFSEQWLCLVILNNSIYSRNRKIISWERRPALTVYCDTKTQGYNARKFNFSCVYSAYILKPEFVNKNRCISVRLVSEEVKSIKFNNYNNSHISFLWPEYFIVFFLCERWIPCQASTSVLCLHYRPETVHCSTKMRAPLK